MKRYLAALLMATAASAALSGCNSTNNALSKKTQYIEYYRIYDLKTSALRQAVGRAMADGLGQNTSNINTALPIPSSAEPPEKPARFKIVDPLAGSRLGMLASASGGLGMKIAQCDGAAWTGHATRNQAGSSALNLWACLFPYKDGYHIDMYAVFAKVEGGLTEISRQMAYAAVGTPEEWVEKTFSDTLRHVHQQIGGTITYQEGFPEPGPLPWLDGGARFEPGKTR